VPDAELTTVSRRCNGVKLKRRSVMKSKSYELVSGAVFGVIATFQAIRAVLQVPAQVGAQVVPVWISWVAVVVAGCLCIWAFRTARQGNIGSRERVVRVVGGALIVVCGLFGLNATPLGLAIAGVGVVSLEAIS
jgi:hypothetical protein